MRYSANMKLPTVPVATFSFGSWRISLDREELALSSLQASYDQVASNWSQIIACLRYRDAYRSCMASLPKAAWLLNGNEELNVLDCGIGAGDLSLALIDTSSRPVNLSGIDISSGMLAQAEVFLDKTTAQFCLSEGNASQLPYEDGSFDLVMCAHLLEHFSDPAVVLSEMHRVLRPGGTILVCLTRRSLLGFWVHLKWRAQMIADPQAAAMLENIGFQSVRKLPAPASGLFRRMSFALSAEKKS